MCGHGTINNDNSGCLHYENGTELDSLIDAGENNTTMNAIVSVTIHTAQIQACIATRHTVATMLYLRTTLKQHLNKLLLLRLGQSL